MSLTIDQKLDLCADYLVAVLQKNAPKDTWNLTLNAIAKVWYDGIPYVIVGGEIAPYAVYTNEKWETKEISYTTDKLFGKKVEPYEVKYTRDKPNPNEGWINKSIEECIPTFKSVLTGKYSKSEIESKIALAGTSLEKQRQAFIDALKKERDKL